MLDTVNSTTKPKRPNLIDIHVGSRIRLRRTMLGMSQEVLAGTQNITFQQIQKYEKGSNRVGASRLQGIAEALSVPVSYFFDGQGKAEPSGDGMGDEVTAFMQSREGIALNRAFAAIADKALRRKLLGVAKAIAEQGATGEADTTH
jgi:transcriptional regulator with XRE-family HTH domain